jgi:hypothetical protein
MKSAAVKAIEMFTYSIEPEIKNAGSVPSQGGLMAMDS